MHKYVTNPTGLAVTLGGVHFYEGIHKYTDDEIAQAQTDHFGRGKMLGNDLLVTNEIIDVTADFRGDDLLDLVRQSIFTDGFNTMSQRVEKLRELYHALPIREVREYLVSLKKKWESGQRRSWFEDTGETMEIQL